MAILPPNSAAMQLGFPRCTPYATFGSTGSSAANFPPSNAGILPLTQSWRSLDLQAANTVLTATFNPSELIQMVAVCRHNLSLTATYRLQLYSDAGMSILLYDSHTDPANPSGTDIPVWSVAFPRGSVPWLNPHTWNGLYTLREIQGYQWHLPIALAQPYLVGGVKLTLSDPGNISGQGIGYLSAPGVQVTDTTGSGAVVTANVTSQMVTSYTVVSPGSLYSASPVVTVAGGSGRGALALATVVTGAITAVTPLNQVEVGLLEMAGIWQSSCGWDLSSSGSGFGFRFRTQVTEALGGGKYFDRRDKVRFFKGSISLLQRDEVMANPWEILRQYDLDTPFFMLAYPFEPVHWIRTAFLMRSLDPGAFSWSNYGVNFVPLSVEEVLT